MKCNTCAFNKYDYTDELSTTFSFVEGTYGFRDYGSASTSGMEALDRVCIAEDVCVNDFNLFIIFWQSGLSEMEDGILGLSTGADPTTGPLYIDALYD